MILVVGVMMAVLTWPFFLKGKETSCWRAVVILSIVSTVSIIVFSIHPKTVITFCKKGTNNIFTGKQSVL
ncbi:hypothetical protein [Alteribacillus bidgolensis]|uniref:hypothetical protein n=1 Tax=Alteribacillus bidgolensis TaxID=930129 RepID=UPI000B8615F5|nr:hypothetical protein [Alteribacillus bidgolensis]